MSSVLRHSGFQSATQRPMVGDTKTSMVRADHIGWLLCDGRELSQSEYRSLYAVLGDDFGPAVASGYFKLPDARGHVMGLINQPNEYTATPRTDVSGWTDGDVSGEETHTLIIAEMPAHRHGPTDVSGNTDGTGLTGVSGEHTHSITDPGHTHSYVNNVNNQNADNPFNTETAADDADLNQTTGSSTTGITINSAGRHAHTIGRTGGSQPHNNMQPTLFLGNFFIYGGRVNYNVTGFNGDVAPTAQPSYYPPQQNKRLY
jgi:microcystin-dependent protein